MIRKVYFESQERRINQVLAALKENGINSIEEANEICEKAGVDPYQMCEDTQRICFENAKWAYVCGAAIAIKKGVKTAADAAEAIGIGLQSFCIPGSVADDRKVGVGHGNLAARLLREETECFAFLAGHESFAAAEGAIKIAEMANKVRQKPLRVILNGLGKDAAQIISRINGFTYVQTQFDYYTSELKIVKEVPYGNNPSRLKVKCYGADDVREGVAILWHENVDVSITGNSTNPTRFQHPVAGTYKKERVLAGKPYFSVASGGGTGRTLHPDNMAAGPASYGMTDTLGRMHSDAQFAGSSSVPAHVEMMGFLGIGNNPMVTVDFTKQITDGTTGQGGERFTSGIILLPVETTFIGTLLEDRQLAYLTESVIVYTTWPDGPVASTNTTIFLDFLFALKQMGLELSCRLLEEYLAQSITDAVYLLFPDRVATSHSQ